MSDEIQPPDAGNLLNEVLTALVTSFERAGLGGHIRSWIGGGEKRPVTPEQIEQAIPPERLAHLAQAHHFPPGTVAGVLAHLLPHAVGNATENVDAP